MTTLCRIIALVLCIVYTPRLAADTRFDRKLRVNAGHRRTPTP